jgi:5-(aminomethyl)-3-furanmethanol phosphate kinase
VAEAGERGRCPLIVKVGGSLAETGRLACALATIAGARVPVVVVPGGGPFADSVRSLQPELHFSDAVAHRLAMLGMHQMAECMVSLQEGFEIAATLDDIAAVLEKGRIPVWAPLHMVAGDATVPADWSATSDSLAARLAELLGGTHLVLLKSVDAKGASAQELASRGVVDPVFPAIVARGGLSWSIFGPQDEEAFAALLAGPGDA